MTCQVNFKTLYSHQSDTGIHDEDGSNVLKLFREAVAWLVPGGSRSCGVVLKLSYWEGPMAQNWALYQDLGQRNLMTLQYATGSDWNALYVAICNNLLYDMMIYDACICICILSLSFLLFTTIMAFATGIVRDKITRTMDMNMVYMHIFEKCHL